MANVRLLSKASAIVNARWMDRQKDDTWKHQSSWPSPLDHVAKIFHKILLKWEVWNWPLFNFKVFPKFNGSMENSEMYSGTVECTTVDIPARLQDCSYSSFKNLQKVLLKCMKNCQFFNFKVSPKSDKQTTSECNYHGLWGRLVQKAPICW
mgnify:CR=1 FL=1